MDAVTIERARGEVEDGWNMPVVLDLEDTESESDSPPPSGPGERKRKSPVPSKANGNNAGAIGNSTGSTRSKRRRAD